jgi:very-short-patch-repair endonuclease
MPRIFNKTSEKEKRKFLRNNMPKAELVLWSKVKGKQFFGYKFRRQYSVGAFVLDFYCPELKLAIEIDGDSHATEYAEEYDIERQKYIEATGIKFLRFSNGDIFNNLENVLVEMSKNIPNHPL